MLVMCNSVLGHLYYNTPYLYINMKKATTYHLSHCLDIPLKVSSKVNREMAYRVEITLSARSAISMLALAQPSPC